VSACIPELEESTSQAYRRHRACVFEGNKKLNCETSGAPIAHKSLVEIIQILDLSNEVLSGSCLAVRAHASLELTGLAEVATLCVGNVRALDFLEYWWLAHRIPINTEPSYQPTYQERTWKLAPPCSARARRRAK
jgi:hypothetical protein